MKKVSIKKKFFLFLILGLYIIVGILVGCSNSDEYYEEDNINLSLEGIIDFEEYQLENDYIILSFYEVKNGKLDNYIKPLLDEELYEYFEDSLEYTYEELEALQYNDQLFLELWDYTSRIIPKEYLEKIYYFEIFTDGMEETLGSIEDISDKLNHGEEGYILSLDISDMVLYDGKLNEELFVGTVIHELGHMITLSMSQLTVVDYEASDPNTFYLFDDDKDTNPNSYLNLFFQRFWVDIYDEWLEIDYYFVDDEDKFTELLDEFYEKYENQFVSDYAPTNPTEDIAESFMAFVMQEKPTSNLIREEKIKFFYEFEEMVKIREFYKKNW